MSYMRHHAIVVTTYAREYAEKAREEATKMFHPHLQVGNICGPVVNGLYSFVVFPDGSKEGWVESERGDGDRARFKAWLRVDGNYEWVEVEYGWDGPAAAISDDSYLDEERSDAD